MIQTNKKISLNIVKRHSGLKIKSKCLYFEVRKVDLGLNLALFCTGSALTFFFYLSTSNRNGLNPGSAPSKKNIFKAHVIFIIIMSFTEDNRDLVDWICDSLKKIRCETCTLQCHSFSILTQRQITLSLSK